MNIYVGNLDYQVTEEQLRTEFEKFGEVESAKIIEDKFTGRAKGFGFVEMPNKEEAEAAIQGLNGKEINGRAVSVNESRPKPEGERRGGGRPGGGGFRGGNRPSGGSGGGRRKY